MERKISFTIGEFYHVYNRGIDKRIIFKNSNDHNRFLALLYLANSSKDIHISNELVGGLDLNSIFDKDRGDQLVAIGAFCLMPNHFHILITPLVEGGVSKFMLKVQTGYSMYFNKKYNRSGSLFQGPFKARHADSDEYLKYLYAYIHLNPIKLKQSDWKDVGIKDQKQAINLLSSYEYSSWKEYKNKNFKIVNHKSFPEYFVSPVEMLNDLYDWLNIKGYP